MDIDELKQKLYLNGTMGSDLSPGDNRQLDAFRYIEHLEDVIDRFVKLMCNKTNKHAAYDEAIKIIGKE